MKAIQLIFFAIIASTICFAQEKPPGVVVDHLPKTEGKYIGSPSICILPNGDYVASHDEFGPESSEFRSAVTRIFSSSDKGASWKEISMIQGLFWSNLFVHNGVLYNIGTNKHHGNLVIRKSTDGGKTWTNPYSSETGLILEGEYHTAPMPVTIHNGRIWRAVEYATAPSIKWGERYSAMMISAPVNSDLLNAKNWQKSNHLAYNPAYLDGKFGAWLEGNAVVSPDGKMLDILRVQVPAGKEYAAMVHISKNGKEASFDPATGFIEFPGGSKKFTIRYDAQSKRYWTISNIVAPQFSDIAPGSVRNIQALSSSADLRTWQVHEILLQHPEVKLHGFQYVDWQFEGDDIVFLSRTAYDDETGGARNNHDANYLTFHRVQGFRALSAKTTDINAIKLAVPEDDKSKTGALTARDFVFGDDRPFKECHASTLVRLNDGNFLVAWFGGTREKDPDVGIWLSKGRPGNWSAPRQVAKIRNDAHWNPVLFDDGKGTVYLYFKVGKEIPIWETWEITSRDGGATWSEPVELEKGNKGGRGPVRNKPIMLSNGAWLAGASYEDGQGDKLWDVFVDRSEDNGKTWKATPYLTLDRSRFNGRGVIQPTLWESAPGNVHMLVRSTDGKIYRSDSKDYGKTWCALYATDMPNNNSGIDLVKLPDGRLVLVYNPVSGNWASRASLNLAVSYDNGVTWPKKIALENDSEKSEYSYPAIIAYGNRVALTYTWKRQKVAFWEFETEKLE